MALVWQDLSCEQDADQVWTFTPPVIIDASGLNNIGSQTYYNFTGASAKFQIHTTQQAASTALLSLTTSSGMSFVSVQSPGGPASPTPHNAIKVTITAAQSKAIASGNYFYSLSVSWGSGGTGTNGTNQTFMAGNFIVVPMPTQP